MSTDIDPGTIVIPEYEARLREASGAADQRAINAIQKEYHAARKKMSKTVEVEPEPVEPETVSKEPVAPTPKTTPANAPETTEVTTPVTRSRGGSNQVSGS